MEPYKLFLLAKKLHPSLRTKVPSVICQLILKDTHYEPIRNLLTGKQIIILSFLINGLNRTEDISSLYEQMLRLRTRPLKMDVNHVGGMVSSDVTTVMAMVRLIVKIVMVMEKFIRVMKMVEDPVIRVKEAVESNANSVAVKEKRRVRNVMVQEVFLNTIM